MIKYVKLTEILESLNEAESTTHSIDRLADRVTSFKNFKIFNDNINIGRVNFTKNNLNEISKNLEKVKNKDFDKNKRFAVIICKLELNKNNVEFEKGFNMKDINENTYLENSLTGSYGNHLICIIEENEIQTIMWVKNDKVNIKHLRVDELINII